MMADTCLTCKHFDPDDTCLPVCEKHHKFIYEEWTCGEHEEVSYGAEEGSKGEAGGHTIGH